MNDVKFYRVSKYLPNLDRLFTQARLYRNNYENKYYFVAFSQYRRITIQITEDLYNKLLKIREGNEKTN